MALARHAAQAETLLSAGCSCSHLPAKKHSLASGKSGPEQRGSDCHSHRVYTTAHRIFDHLIPAQTLPEDIFRGFCMNLY